MNYVDDIEKWKKHFLLMSEGKIKPNDRGKYFVNSQSGGANSNEPRIQFVTPIAQAIELAKSQLKEEETGAYKKKKNDYKSKPKRATKKRGNKKEKLAKGKSNKVPTKKRKLVDSLS